MKPELEAVREALVALPDDAAHALDPEPIPASHDIPPGVPPPPPFVLAEHIAGKPDAALRAAQDAALAAGLSPQDANAAGRAAAEYVLAHGTSPETAHKRELLRGTEAGLPPDEVVRLAREAGDRAAAAREAVRAPQTPLPAPPAIPLPEPTPEIAREAPPFAVPLPDAPAPPLAFPADVAGPAAGVFGLEVPPVPGPADVAVPGAPPVPVPDAAGQGPGGGTPPWWDPLLGAVVGAEPESPTPPWWDQFLGQVVEPGTAAGRPPVLEAAAPAPSAPGAGHLAEAAALAREAEGEPRAVPLPQPPGALPVLGEADLAQDETWYHPFREPGAGRDAAFEGIAGGGEGPGIMAVLERIASGIDRLVDIMSQDRAGEPGAARFRRPDFGDGGPDWDDEDDDPDVPASPSVDRYDLWRPGQERVETSRPEGQRRPRQPKHHDEPGTGVG